MNSFFFNNSASHHQNQHHQQQHSFAHPNASHIANNSHNHHGGRSRRAPRVSSQQHAQRQFRGVKSMRELAAAGAELPTSSIWRAKFEAGRSFDLADDEDFIPGLLTEEDVRHPSDCNEFSKTNCVSSVLLSIPCPTALRSPAAHPIRHPCSIRSSRPSMSLPLSTSPTQPSPLLPLPTASTLPP